MHAVDPKQIKANRTMMNEAALIHAISQLQWAPWMTLTGGDPCLQKHLDMVFPFLNNTNIRIAIETQGEEWPDWLKKVDVATFSPKGPSSGNITEISKFAWELGQFRLASNAQIAVKVVVFDDADLDYAFEMMQILKATTGPPLYNKFYFQVGSPLPQQIRDEVESEHDAKGVIADIHEKNLMVNTILEGYRVLTEHILMRSDELDHLTAVTPQTHALIWPMEDKGR